MTERNTDAAVWSATRMELYVVPQLASVAGRRRRHYTSAMVSWKVAEPWRGPLRHDNWH